MVNIAFAVFAVAVLAVALSGGVGAAPEDEGRPTVSDDVRTAYIPNLQPLCRQVGVWRFSTGALLIVLGLGTVGVEVARSRRMKGEPMRSPVAAPA